MTRWIAMALLCAGVVLASLGGARNGDAYAAHRARVGADEVSVVPGPDERLAGWWRAGGPLWAAGLALIVVGAGLARREQANDAAGGDGRAVDFGEAIERVRRETDAIASMVADLPMDADHPEARERLDRLSLEQLGPMVEARGAWVARHGLATFAEYFGPFSGGERQLARAWSAITDGHAEVARSSLASAATSFAVAAAAWDAVVGRGGGSR